MENILSRGMVEEIIQDMGEQESLPPAGQQPQVHRWFVKAAWPHLESYWFSDLLTYQVVF